ncbi:MAG: rhomboid family intramembrane serine protease [Bacteroidaceae bacterium]|nr:rhomboid family intramembrane serine protease [Bacteroidaceae bacterium]
MFDKLLRRFKTEDVVGKYIFVNAAVFIIIVFIGVFSVLFNLGEAGNSIVRFLELPSSLQQLLSRPWSLLTYMFVHKNFMHILWNMVSLYVFGKIFLNFFSVRHFVGTYILGGLSGGVAFVLAYNLFPYFAPYVENSYLVGASAAVLAIVVASAVRNPDYRINLAFVGSVKLSAFAVVTVAISFFMISGSNAGGNIAHLGGAAAGWLVTSMLNKGVDLTSVVNKPIDWVVKLFSGKCRPRRKKPKFTYSKGGRNADYEYNARKRAAEDDIDRILDKIKKGGYNSLSEDEKKRLFDASKR